MNALFKKTAEKKLIILSVSLLFLLLACNKDDDNISSYSTMELEILMLINQHRISNNLGILNMNQFIYEQALAHNDYMIAQKTISHDNFNERFSIISDELGISSIAENVAAGQTTAEQVVSAWLDSPGHRENIEGNYNLTGISAKKDSNGKYYYTQIFAK